MTPSSPIPSKFFWDCTKDEKHLIQRSTMKHMTTFLLGEQPPAFKQRLEAAKPLRQPRGLAADPSLFLQASLGSSHAPCRQTDRQTDGATREPASTPSCSSCGPRPPWDASSWVVQLGARQPGYLDSWAWLLGDDLLVITARSRSSNHDGRLTVGTVF